MLKRFISSTILALALPALLLAQPPGGEQPPTNVEAEPAVVGPVLDEVKLTGSIVPVRATRVSSEVAAQVAEVIVDAGTLVDQGQPLLRLRSTPAELEVLEAEASLALEKANLEELLNGTRAEDIEVEKAQVAEAEADLELAQADYKRVEDLLGREAVSQSEFDRAAAELHKAEARLAREKAELSRALEGSRKERIEAARANVASAEAVLSQYRDDLDRHTVRAPFRGVIGEKLVEAGQWVRIGDPLFSLAELDVLRAQVELPERYFSRVRQGTPTTLIIDALEDKRLEAPVSVKVPLGDMASRTFPVWIDIKNEGYRIAPGMLVRAEIALPDDEAGESLLVPKDAVVLSPTRDRYVWVAAKGENGLVAERRQIEAGRSFQSFTEVLSGDVKEGDMVVVRGNEMLRPGQAIAIKKPSDKLTQPMQTATAESGVSGS